MKGRYRIENALPTLVMSLLINQSKAQHNKQNNGARMGWLSPCLPVPPPHSCPVTESMVVSHLRPITTKNLPSPFPLSTLLSRGHSCLGGNGSRFHTSLSWLLGVCGDALPQVAPPEFLFFVFFQGSLKWGAKCELWEFEGSFPPSRFAYSVGNGISQQDVEPQR